MVAPDRTTPPADRLDRALRFISHLNAHNVDYELRCVRPDALMVSIRTPLHGWEIEFMTSDWDDPIQVERLAATADGVEGDEHLPELFEELDIPELP